jgi:formylglycine-generating enzyme required for sulfatase activity
VSWEEANGYAVWLKRTTGKDYRLVTEAEWEYAARAGSQARYSFGDDETPLGDYACYHENSDARTHRVATKKPNAFGLYDVHGNVWQWVGDCYHGSYEGAPSDGSAWVEQCNTRVFRGDSRGTDPQNLRSAIRSRGTPAARGDNLGIRVGRTLTP